MPACRFAALSRAMWAVRWNTRPGGSVAFGELGALGLLFRAPFIFSGRSVVVELREMSEVCSRLADFGIAGRDE